MADRLRGVGHRAISILRSLGCTTGHYPITVGMGPFGKTCNTMGSGAQCAWLILGLRLLSYRRAVFIDCASSSLERRVLKLDY